jgi:hypothetical protein
MSATPRTPGLGELTGVGSSSAAAERVVNTNSVELPLLTKANYHEWALVMQVSLEAMELWDAVEAVCRERAKDRRALAAILRAVPPEMKAGLAVKKSAKEAWAAVRSMRMGDARVREANAERLLKVFENIKFKEGEKVDDFAMRLSSLISEMRELGEEVEELRVVRKLLRVVPPKFNQVAASIEMLCDLKTMPLEELVGRLRVAENRFCLEETTDELGRLLLTEEQWQARRRSKNRAHGGDRRRGGREKGGGCSDGHDDSDDDSDSPSSIRARSRYRGRCFDCGDRGHMAKDCRAKKKEKALLVVDADDEPTLL